MSKSDDERAARCRRIIECATSVEDEDYEALTLEETTKIVVELLTGMGLTEGAARQVKDRTVARGMAAREAPDEEQIAAIISEEIARHAN